MGPGIPQAARKQTLARVSTVIIELSFPIYTDNLFSFLPNLP